MKHLFSNLTMVAILVTTVMFTSCQKEEVNNPSETGKLSFGFNLKTQVLNKGMEGPELKTTSNINPVAVIANLVDENGRVVFKNKRIKLYKKDGVYTSQPQELEQGNYTLTDYCLVDADSVIVGAAFKKNEASSSELITTLPIKVTVSKGEIATLSPEVMSTKVELTTVNGLKAGIPNSVTFTTNVINNLGEVSIGIYDEAEEASVYIYWGDGSTPEIAILSVKGEYNNLIEKITSHKYETSGNYSIMLFGDTGELFGVSVSNSRITDANLLGASNLKALGLDRNLLVNDNNLQLPNGLEALYVNNNQISSMDLSSIPKLRILHIFRNNLVNVDFVNTPNIEYIEISNNDLTNLDVTGLPNLWKLNCSDNQLSSLDVSQNLNLEQLYSSNNADIEYLDITQNNKLNVVFINGLVKMTSLDISKNVDLTEIRLKGTSVKDLDFTSNPKLKFIDWRSNVLQEDDVNVFYKNLFNHADVNNVIRGSLYIDGVKPTDPAAIKAKQDLVNTYNWTINE